MPRITHFCSCIYVLGCRLSLVRLCDSDFGITPVDDITIGITCAAFCFHVAHISFASSWYLFCLSVIVFARLCVFGTAMSVKKLFFVFLFIKVMSGPFKGAVVSVSMLRLCYSLKFSFSSILLLLLLLLLLSLLTPRIALHSCPVRYFLLIQFYRVSQYYSTFWNTNFTIITVFNISREVTPSCSNFLLHVRCTSI